MKVSGGPNASVSNRTTGMAAIRTTIPTRPPRAEAVAEIARARLASPRLAMGYPSMVVAAFAGVPGMLSRIAGTDPPKVLDEAIEQRK